MPPLVNIGGLDLALVRGLGTDRVTPSWAGAAQFALRPVGLVFLSLVRFSTRIDGPPALTDYPAFVRNL